MVEKNKHNQGKGSTKVQSQSKSPGGAFPVKEAILLRKNWEKLIMDGRTYLAKQTKKVEGILLDPFKPPAPGHAQMLARITATNIMLALRLEGYMHTGQVAPSTFQDYMRLTNAISTNLMRLYSMARDGGPVEKIPNLQEYLATLKEAGGVTDAAPAAKVAADPNPDPEPKPKTLF